MHIYSENAINELLGIYNEHMGKQQEGKQPEPSTSIKAPKLKLKQIGEKMELDDDVNLVDKIKKQLFTSEGKVSSQPPLKTFSDSNSNTPLSQQSVVSVTGGKKKRNASKNNKNQKTHQKNSRKPKKRRHTKTRKIKIRKKHNKKTKKMKKKRKQQDQIKETQEKATL